MIVALKEQSRVYLAADSLFRDSGKFYHHKKIVQCEPNQVLMAGQGNPKLVQQICHGLQFNAPRPDMETCSIYLSNIEKTFKEEWNDYFELLIVGDARIMHITSEGLVEECPHFEAIGGGRELAMIGLELTGQLPPDVRLHSVFTAVAKYTDYVGGEVDVQFV